MSTPIVRAAPLDSQDLCVAISSNQDPLYLCNLQLLLTGLDSFWQVRPLALFVRAVQALAKGADGTGSQISRL